LEVNFRHLGAIVDAVNPDPAGMEQIQQLADEGAGIDEQTANADPALGGPDASRDLGIDLGAAAG